MSKEDQKIIVIEKNILFGKDYFNGFKSAREVNYEQRILANIKVMRRGDAENDPTHKQPIGYAIVMNSKTKKVFAYQRSSKDKEYGEKRLQGKWSWGFGGHIEPSDNSNGNPIKDSVFREVNQEELEVFGKLKYPRVLGYINDDSDDVGKVHFGILYLINTDAIKAKPRDPEIAKLESLSLSELERMCSSPDFTVESWSEIALGPLRKLL